MKRTLFLAALAVAGCTEELPGLTGTQSLEVEVVAPANLGTVDQRLSDADRTITVNLTAKDADNAVDASFDRPVRVYAQFLGTLTPSLDEMPLATITMSGGMAAGQTITLPPSVLGPTTLWFDDGSGLGPEYMHGMITGTSPTLWYRDPFIRDLQTPRDEAALDALSTAPLSDKQISVNASRHGAQGRLVVTSTFAQGYTVSDVRCADAAGSPPCTAEAYDHVMVFTFSAPRDQHHAALEVGESIERFTGGLSEFNGLSEIGFPRTYVADAPEVNPARVPAPVRLELSWFGPISDPNGMINFERNEAGAIEIVNGYVCPLDDDYTTYKQWKINPAGTAAGCTGKNVINVITQGSDFSTDPATLVGTVLPRVVGILRPVNIGSFNVWIIFPRGSSDVTLQ